MPDFIHDVPQLDLARWFAFAALFLAFAGVFFVKPVLRLIIGREPDINAKIGYATASVSLFYGLLLGLLTVSAYQNQDQVETSILNEAAAAGALYSDMNAYPEPIRSNVREMLRDYVLYTIHKDWPAHRRGEVLVGGANRADAMRQLLASFEPVTQSEVILHRETISSFQQFSGNRQDRLNGVTTRIPDVLWYAVLVGAIVNVVLMLMLSMRPIPHFILGAINTFFLGVVLFVIVTLDDPLRGSAGLGPEPFELLWERQMQWDEPQI